MPQQILGKRPIAHDAADQPVHGRSQELVDPRLGSYRPTPGLRHDVVGDCNFGQAAHEGLDAARVLKVAISPTSPGGPSILPRPRPGGGTGRHSRLKICRPQGHASSILALGTTTIASQQRNPATK